MDSADSTRRQAEIFIAELQRIALFAEVLDYYLEHKKMRPAHLAKKIYVRPTTIHNWRKHKRLPENLGIVHQLSEALNLDDLEKKNLVIAWHVTRTAKDFIPYIEQACKTGDIAEAIDLVKEVLKVSNAT